MRSESDWQNTRNLQFEFSRSPIWGSLELPTANTATTEQTDGAEAILVDFSDGLEVLMAVPVCILSTWTVTWISNCQNV